MVENKSLNTAKNGTARSSVAGNGAAKNTTPSVASENLRRAEENAGSMSLDQTNDGVENVAENEEEAGGLYTGTGKAEEGEAKGKGFFKRKGPMALIIGLIFGVGGFMGGAQLFQPFSLVEQFRETFNSMQTSVNTRSNRLLKYQMDKGLVKYPTRVRFGKAEFSLSKKQKNKLKQNGIEYDEDMKALVYVDDETGRTKIVAADESAVARIKTDFDLDSNTDVTTFKVAYEDDLNFYRGYNSASLTWRGAIANWFESATLKFLIENKLTRSLFTNYRQELDESGGNVKATTIDMIAKGTENIEEGGKKTAVVEGVDSDGDDSVDGVNFKDDPESGVSGKRTIPRSSLTVDGVKAEIDRVRQIYGKADTGSGITGAAQSVANYTCLVFNFLGGVSLLVSASEALQIIHLVMAYFEAVDKVKAGDGANSPINELATTLNERSTNKHTTLTTPTGEVIVDNVSKLLDGATQEDLDRATEQLEKTVVPETTTSNKTAMEASGIVALYGGGKVNPDDPSVQSFNFTNSIKTVLGGIGVSMATFTGCSIAKLTTNLASILEQAWTVYTCIAGAVNAGETYGISLLACLPALIEVISAIGFSVAAGLLITGIISVITPVATQMLTRDLITNLGGEDLGNALASGANMYMGNTHRFNGGSLSNIEKYKEFAVAQKQVIAENAKYERMVRDPFDITSKYTFMGNLMTQMMSFLSVNSLMGVVSSAGTVVSSSVAALSPGAVAYEISSSLPDSMEAYERTCPYLASIGAVGDAYCNPYAITDLSTINEDPSVVIENLSDNFLDDVTDDGNVQIKAGSDLAKYIIFCDNRNSAFGLADQNIVNQVTNIATVDTESAVFNNTVNSAIGAIPFIGDSIDVLNNAKALLNAGYVDGESCVAGNSAVGTNWDTAKKYQRFIEDQSLMESMGLIEKSAVTAFLDDYYEKNPLDNSYEGTLARYSGMSKEDVIAILDILEYGNYIAQYDASERYAFGAPVVEEKHDLIFDNENQVAENIYIILLNDIEFADVRNRNFVV